MKVVLLLVAVLGLGALGGFPVGSGTLCMMAMAQEQEVPDGHWCQRAERRMSKKAHACSCHQHDCKADQRDINNLSAHTDPKCLDYCHTGKCLCAAMDCQ